MTGSAEAWLETTTGRRHPMLLGGALHAGNRSAPHHSAVDGRSLGTIAIAGETEVRSAGDAAVAARAACAAIPTWRRVQICESVSRRLGELREPLARLMAIEVAKPIDLASMEVDRAIATFRSAAHVAATLAGEVIALDQRPGLEGREAIVRRVPAGPVLAITPFNFPLNLVAHKVAPAVVAGCPVILKPAPAAPLTACVLAQLVVDAGWPAAGLQVIPLDDDALAKVWLDDARIRVLSFTGSAAVGWKLRDAARGKVVALELGGDASAIINHDADLDRAAERCAFGAFAYAGQVCIGVQRIFVHAEVAERFRERLLARAAEFPTGNPLDSGVLLGPVLRDRDAERIGAWISEAVAGGARVLHDGGRRGRSLGPMVIEAVPPQCRLGCEEVFGPVVEIVTFRSLDEVIARMNASQFGLQAGVFTQSLPVVRKLRDSLEVGALVVDDVPTLRIDEMPYGGSKASGLGREGVRYALEHMTELRTLLW